MSDLEAWDRRTAELLEDAYVAAGAGPGGSGCLTSTEDEWRAKREVIADAFRRPGGTWLDVGCANGHLMATMQGWLAERDIDVEPHGLELLPRVADLARSLHPQWAERIWTGSVMTWSPPRRFTYVTVLDDVVPLDRLGDLVRRLLGWVEPGGRLVVDDYGHHDDLPSALAACGHPPTGGSVLERGARPPVQVAWFDVD